VEAGSNLRPSVAVPVKGTGKKHENIEMMTVTQRTALVTTEVSNEFVHGDILFILALLSILAV
jgi:hypothetical protein